MEHALKRVTIVKMGKTCKNGSHLEKMVNLWKIGVTLAKKWSHLKTWVTLGKKGYLWKNRSHL